MKKQAPTLIESILAKKPDVLNRKRIFTLAEDAAIVKFAESKGYNVVGEVLGVSPNTVKRRFLELKKRMKS